jgi:hypothetical protein
MLLVEATNSEHLHVSDKLVFLQDWGGGWNRVGAGLDKGIPCSTLASGWR